MDILILLINLLQYILWAYLAIVGGYLFLFAVAGLFPMKRITDFPEDTDKRIVVLIPGYKEDNVILGVAEAALQQEYPAGLYDVVIIADSFQQGTLDQLRKLPVKVIEVSFELSTKAKALSAAVNQLGDQYDICIILDADNIMEAGFLRKISHAFKPGVLAVQGHRTAKNQNTAFAILDAISEEINNHVFRKGHRNIGLSAAIIGSGVGFDYSYFKSLIPQITAVGGFDKEIELKMLRDGHTIHYLHDAMVYDEKVQKPEVFSNQRRRWLSAQVHYFRQYFLHSLGYLLRYGNIEYFNKAFQFLQLPRVLLLATLIVLTPLAILYNTLQRNPEMLMMWVVLSIGIFTAIAISVPRRMYNRKMAMAALHLPKGMVLMLMSLLRIKGANKKFIHTAHGTHNETK